MTSTGSGNSLLDISTGESTLLIDEPGFRKIGPDHIDLRRGDWVLDSRIEAPLWRYDYDGSEPRQLAERVSGVFRDIGERTVTTLDLDDRWLGNFVVVDPESLAELHIDDHASWLSPALSDGEPFGPDTLAYAVSDGDRSGVWIVRPAAE